jgi:hypothetical protein
MQSHETALRSYEADTGQPRKGHIVLKVCRRWLMNDVPWYGGRWRRSLNCVATAPITVLGPFWREPCQAECGPGTGRARDRRQ